MRRHSLAFLGALFLSFSLVSCDLSIFDIVGGGPSSSPLQDSHGFEDSLHTQNGFSQVRGDISLEDYGEVAGTLAYPSKGSQKLLVLPIIIEDYELSPSRQSKIISDLEALFNGEADETGWESVRSFYEASSYGQLQIEATIAPWYDSDKTIEEIDRQNSSSLTSEGVSYLMREAIEAYRESSGDDLSSFDSNQDGFIDGVWMVYSAPHDLRVSGTLWAFTYWDYEAPELIHSPSRPLGYTYCWASYDFMYAGYGETAVDCHTFVHETGHMLGLMDYYDTAYNRSPLGYLDMMDANVIDHNAYTKFSLGWINPYLVDRPGEITISPQWKSGDAILVPTEDGWNGSSFDEYLLIELYDPHGLNEQDSVEGYSDSGQPAIYGFREPGIRVYHVDARLCLISSTMAGNYFDGFSDDLYISSNGYERTLMANTNTYGESYAGNDDFTLLTLITPEQVNIPMAKTNYLATDELLFHEGDSFSLEGCAVQFPYDGSDYRAPNSNDESGFALTFTVSDIASDGSSATIAFTYA